MEELLWREAVQQNAGARQVVSKVGAEHSALVPVGVNVSRQIFPDCLLGESVFFSRCLLEVSEPNMLKL